MKRVLLILVLGVMVLSCKNKSEKKLVVKIQVPEINLHIDDSIINVVRFISPLKLKYKRNTSKYPIYETDSIGSVLYVLNKNENLYLKMIIIPGSGENEFGMFEIGYVNYKIKKISKIETNQKEFISKFGLKLGMNYNEVLDILNNKGYTKYLKKENNSIYLTLSIDSNIYFIENYNLPLYTAKYVFKDNKLCLYKFGFENP